MEEIWKPIKNYENVYEISNFGNVRSLDRQKTLINGTIKVIKGKILKKQRSRGKEYYSVGLYDNNGKQHVYQIHRLVAQAFVPNPNNFTIVNHLDENKQNNHVDNLEWTTIENNNQYSYNKHPERKNVIEILQYTLEGDFVKKWNSIKEAAEYLNTKQGNISECLRGNSKSSSGYIWKYYYDDNYPLKIQGYSNNSKYRKIIQYDLFGNFVKVWDSMIDIEKELNIKIHGINDCCKGNLSQSGNYIWKFYENNFPTKISTKFKRVLQYDLNGNLLNTFNSAYEAALSINKPNNQGMITGCCKGTRKTAYGFKWKYEE